MAEQSIMDRVTQEITDAMKARDKVRLRTLRGLRSALMNKTIEKREGGDAQLDDTEQLAVVRKQVKQRKDSIEQFEEAGRDDLVAKEQEELEVLKEFMPEPMSDEKLEETIDAIIEDVGASDMSDMGAVMGRAMGQLRGKVDGSRVQRVVKEKLG
ncbi:glutamyl-tRNA amidotransferase [Longibacter salinarum]|uniref:Glutamyl-tRNA amidotransferase n=1 Tax=Longibacter salinarum TaxID=1850348 RepID=A0A2A8D2Q6_9BACT|nr:GatB/YqeY domain-containing protein [Longibacter salinarum]PEN15154.1 glutamyl-tRNA amidotransferase [Longibacter salinarum]